MTEPREPYTVSNAAPLLVTFELTAWERNFILQMRQAAQRGYLVICDPDGQCWWTTGAMQCNKERRDELPFRM